MLKRLSPLFATFALASCLTGCAVTNSATPADDEIPSAAASNEPLFEDDNVLILLASEQEANELTINVSRRGYQLIDRQFLDSLDLILLDFARPPGISDEVAVNDMQMMSPSALVGLDNIYQAQTEMDATPPVSGRAYANLLLDWPEQGCPAMTAVGIIDGYLSDRMSGLNAAQIVSHDFARRESVESEHAETVASLIGGPGRLHGVMIYSAGVVGRSNDGQAGSGTKELLLAFDWLRKQDVRVVNVSLAGPYNPLLESVVDLLVADGMVIVAAVGNEGPDAAPRYPAAFDGVIAVTAIDADQEVFGGAVQGNHVEYAAPGVDVLIQTGQESGRYVSGTSFAAPFVTALIAADESRSFDGDTESVRSYLQRNVFDLGVSGPDPVFGHGLVRASNVCAAKSVEV
ncbi:MAG: S8 family serine peptidase, partial [Pseudomonadota bacterium]